MNNRKSDGVLLSKHFSYLPIPTDYNAAQHNSYGRTTVSINNNPSKLVFCQECSVNAFSASPHHCASWIGWTGSSRIIGLSAPCLHSDL